MIEKNSLKLYEMTAHELQDRMKKGEVTPMDISKSVLERIDDIDKKVKAFISVDRERMMKKASSVISGTSPDVPSGQSPAARLDGIPVAIKDNICVQGEETTCGSRILSGFKPPYNATVIDKLESAGAILMGKVNMDEFAFGSSTETSRYGITHNPWDLDRIPGGSSGGSAAAVASGEAVMALGSDTGGSIRQPASLCGVVGLKPTYGRVSRYGLIAFASSLDQIGPITKDVQDSALLMNVLAGYDKNDSTSVDIPVPDYTKSLINDIHGIRLGIPKEYFIEGMDKEVEKSVRDAIELMKKLGGECVEVSLPHTEYAISVYYLVATAEASSNLARFDGVKYGFRSSQLTDNSSQSLLDMYRNTRGQGFGSEAKRRIILGTYALSAGYYDAYYLKAQKVRNMLKMDFDDAFKRCDCILTPTSPTPAFKIGERINDPLSMYLSDIFTISVNLAGIPAMSIPCGRTKAGLPIGLQILARPFGEEDIFRVAYTYEQNTEWHRMRIGSGI
ncbi:MAG: Asp-tRNA(Asn)/Glu-tRNA(Gln) amidotransferase subunit GatA [Candidatus Omnitrophica bacterium]|nr:Asp-tRNA(Asn)/Glu-tRNA(Gln) amidotransferase subunit GatA [Candidatus Omnitrophota bacterium]